ncbi:hypothetical protein [Tolypothrix sp. NIES-4075]|uniref:hypothetical protein n=1 Tax=Tolypothrix sp. NIES-4075 TaxID=2005459 RepID=UPI000B5CA4C4|nr:hypothetical protein [Tolypothrix sp. NIES-4075]
MTLRSRCVCLFSVNQIIESSAPLYYGNDNDVITAIDGKQTIYAGDGNNIILTGSDRYDCSYEAIAFIPIQK